MIFRGTSHVILSDVEIMERIKKPGCLAVLRQLMWFHEGRQQRKELERMGAELTGVRDSELGDFIKLMTLTQKWLSQPLRLDFGGKNETRSRRNANAGGPGNSEEVNLRKAARRKRNRQRRKDNLNGVCRGS